MANENLYWEAVEKRDRSFDGRFFYGVLTTGVYCRPSCPARRPLRRNVRFYDTPQDAERDGLRPCKRCRPLGMEADPAAEKIRELCRYMEAHSEEPLDLAALSAQAGLSRFHLHRSFKAVTGLTPKQYLDACRVDHLKRSLRQSGGVTQAIYEAGFGSSSRVYERADTRLGMTPKQYREGGRGVAVTYVAVESPVGLMMLAATDRGICSVQLGANEEELAAALHHEFPGAHLSRMNEPTPEFEKWIGALNRHLAGQQPSLHLPLDIRASAFQMLVWNYLQSIPYGEVRSYSEVAQGIGRPSATRAVARACATNRVAIAIPCHRVIRGSGELGGYRWGLARKRALIDNERAARNGRVS